MLLTTQSDPLTNAIHTKFIGPSIPFSDAITGVGV